jgi:hypothetical protein
MFLVSTFHKAGEDQQKVHYTMSNTQPIGGAAHIVPATADATIRFIQDLMAKRFWGNLTVKFQGGIPIHLTQETSIPAEKLLNTTPNHRGAYDNTKQ